MANITVKFGDERVILNNEIAAYSSVITKKIWEKRNDSYEVSPYIELPNVRIDTMKRIVDWAKCYADNLKMMKENLGVEIEGCWEWEIVLLSSVVSKDELLDIISAAKDLMISHLYEAGMESYIRKFGEDPAIEEPIMASNTYAITEDKEIVLLNDEIAAYSLVIEKKISKIRTEFTYAWKCIELPDVSSDSLKIAADWAKRHSNTLKRIRVNDGVEIEGCWDWQAHFLNVSKDELFDIISAAEDLMISHLYEAAMMSYIGKFGEDPAFMKSNTYAITEDKEIVLLNDEIATYSSVIEQEISEIDTEFKYAWKCIELPDVRSDSLKIAVEWAKRHSDTSKMIEENGRVEIEGCWDWQEVLLDLPKDDLHNTLWAALELDMDELSDVANDHYHKNFNVRDILEEMDEAIPHEQS